MNRFDHDVHLMIDEWNALKDDLKTGKVMPDDMDAIKKYDFFAWFHEMVKYVKPDLGVEYKNINNVYRAVHHDSLKEHESDRLIPTKEHAVINKMTPSDRLFLYLGYHDDEEHDLIKDTCAKEIHAKDGDVVSVGKFELNNDDKKIIDLTHNNIPIHENRFVSFVKEEFEKGGEESMRKALVRVIFEVFSLDGTFKPMEGEKDHDLEYAPFHALVNLFENEGFDGMIYRSMVVAEGKNLVLFNHEDATCIPETIHQHVVSN
ncbi:MAG: hypothetical protein N4A47_06350 [Clostridia bacterium]|jgi:hypothetical protein|nr:hypothetical protein [Clostridia bacterium]